MIAPTVKINDERVEEFRRSWSEYTASIEASGGKVNERLRTAIEVSHLFTGQHDGELDDHQKAVRNAAYHVMHEALKVEEPEEQTLQLLFEDGRWVRVTGELTGFTDASDLSDNAVIKAVYLNGWNIY